VSAAEALASAASPSAAAAPPLIELQGVRKVYRMGEHDVPALRGVSLSIRRGEFGAIMGSSGSGKSTLMNILGGLDRPTAGVYRLDGIDVAGLSRDDLARIRGIKIGFVFQSFNLLARTSALENVEMPLLYGHRLSSRVRRERAHECLKRVGLADRWHHHPSQLSGGQQQRVAIARALVNQPVLLLADEPTGNLDSKVTGEIMAVLQRLNDEGLTIALVTHEPDVASYARRKIVVRDGLVVEDGPVANRVLAATIKVDDTGKSLA
jgi:putative ABC transport system ATP-binding protein